ncbi:MAG: hypothetical protein JW864_17640 [Spirochaetes bacterium]|nr:hypothetical protein [Spirochaetota bacterium]
MTEELTKEDFITMLKFETLKASEALNKAVVACSEHNSEEMYHHLYEYILRRFLLFETGCTETRFLNLGKLSARHILRLTGGNYMFAPGSFTCTNAGGAISKKNMLLNNIQVAFNIKIKPEKCAEIKTVEILRDEIIKLSEQTECTCI